MSSILENFSPLLARFERDLSSTVHNFIDVYDPQHTKAPDKLVEAMGYSVLAPGKRLRPLLVFASAQLCASVEHAVDTTALHLDESVYQAALPAALGIEYIHTYSLIHDDLPALDNDALRRGRPTLHIAFDEATAILAGDALLTDAFALVATAPHKAAAQCAELARAAGSAGMVGGQFDDVHGPQQQTESNLRSIHRRKTARLLSAACALGALSHDADDSDVELLRQYGMALGIAFQIADDVLDHIGDQAKSGKELGRDAKLDKTTYVSLYGLEGARQQAKQWSDKAIEILRPWGSRAVHLNDIARFVCHRLF